jgi:hypothetical protein
MDENACGTCMNLFSSLDNLQALKSDEGLILSMDEAVDGSLDGCKICRNILRLYRYMYYHDYRRRTGFYHLLQNLFGRRDRNYFHGPHTSVKLQARCDQDPIFVRRSSDDYPYGILDIRTIRLKFSSYFSPYFFSIFLDPGKSYPSKYYIYYFLTTF